MRRERKRNEMQSYEYDTWEEVQVCKAKLLKHVSPMIALKPVIYVLKWQTLRKNFNDVAPADLSGIIIQLM